MASTTTAQRSVVFVDGLRMPFGKAGPKGVIGMPGARITLHLALELARRGSGTGAAALCGGGG
ncbi:hypothetical protein [Nocardia vinacea]|uniref:hypothetical protein n=1 Tax=Nocardia vinacea TaxID=96468 RepID=UPI002E37465F|nr:hypothetical protein [Nocardia vinacea]